MIDREEIRKMVSSIVCSGHTQNIVDAGIVRDIVVQKERVAFTVVQWLDDPSISQWIEQKIRDVLAPTRCTTVHIRHRLATEQEKQGILLKINPSDTSARIQPGREPTEHSFTIIAVASGKGGVGKTTVAINLAVALERKGLRVGLLDADIYGFSIPEMMNIRSLPAVDDEGNVYPVHHHGISVMSMGFFVEDNAPVVWRGPMLGKMLHKFIHTIQWGPLDILIVDLPPGTGDIALDVHQMLPTSSFLIVTTPHDTAAFVAARAGAMAKKTNHPIIGVVENMSWFEMTPGEKHLVFGSGGGQRLASVLETEQLVQLPLIPLAQQEQTAVYVEHPLMTPLFDHLAVHVIERTQCAMKTD